MPRQTATRSPFLTPRLRREEARVLERESRAEKVRVVSWAGGANADEDEEGDEGRTGERAMTAGRSPWRETIDAKCSGMVPG